MQGRQSPQGLRCHSATRGSRGPIPGRRPRRGRASAVEALRRRQGSERILASDRHPPGVPKRVRRALDDAGVRVHLGAQEELLDLPPRAAHPDQEPRRARRRSADPASQGEGDRGPRRGRARLAAGHGADGRRHRDQRQDDDRRPSRPRSSPGRASMPKLAGNADIAPPLSAVTGDPDAEPDLIVCEISSFQLEGCPALMPEVAVFTNLSHDHLPRHGTMRRYGEVKRSLFIRTASPFPSPSSTRSTSSGTGSPAKSSGPAGGRSGSASALRRRTGSRARAGT